MSTSNALGGVFKFNNIPVINHNYVTNRANLHCFPGVQKLDFISRELTNQIAAVNPGTSPQKYSLSHKAPKPHTAFPFLRLSVFSFSSRRLSQ